MYVMMQGEGNTSSSTIMVLLNSGNRSHFQALVPILPLNNNVWMPAIPGDDTAREPEASADNLDAHVRKAKLVRFSLVS
jgi:hypothetical protein